MLYPGLVSVTFRQLVPGEIVALVQRAGLNGIEWGGDVHVPHGDLDRAREVARLTADAGLTVAAYGSYYRVADDSGKGPGIESVIDTARALEAPTVRVWCGNRGSAAADDAYRDRVATESLRIAELGRQAGIGIVYEWHGNTLTDTIESALGILSAAEHPNLRTLWQPLLGCSNEQGLTELRAIGDRLANLHAYHWVGAAYERAPFQDGTARWNLFTVHAGALPGDRYVLLEFVRDDSPDAFLEDASALRVLLDGQSV